MFRYTPLGQPSPAPRGFLTRFQLRHIIVVIVAITTIGLLFAGTTHHSDVSSFAHTVTSGRIGSPATPTSSKASKGYVPGPLGKSLLAKQRKYLSYTDWQRYLDGHTAMLDTMMDLDVPMITEQGEERAAEGECEGWNSQLEAEDPRWGCWRAKMWKQIEAFEMPESWRWVIIA